MEPRLLGKFSWDMPSKKRHFAIPKWPPLWMHECRQFYPSIRHWRDLVRSRWVEINKNPLLVSNKATAHSKDEQMREVHHLKAETKWPRSLLYLFRRIHKSVPYEKIWINESGIKFRSILYQTEMSWQYPKATTIQLALGMLRKSWRTYSGLAVAIFHQESYQAVLSAAKLRRAIHGKLEIQCTWHFRQLHHKFCRWRQRHLKEVLYPEVIWKLILNQFQQNASTLLCCRRFVSAGIQSLASSNDSADTWDAVLVAIWRADLWKISKK